jgi:hypothetical protein
MTALLKHHHFMTFKVFDVYQYLKSLRSQSSIKLVILSEATSGLEGLNIIFELLKIDSK